MSYDYEQYEKYESFVARLQTKYPKMFSQEYGGISVGPGWWTIIETLCQNIQSYVDWKSAQKEGCEQVVVAQIKEKFGGLRFYYDGGDSTVSGMVRMAEAWAALTCESCGKPGKLRSDGWWRTVCDEHAGKEA